MGQQQKRITDGNSGAKRGNAMGTGSPGGLGGSGGATNAMGRGSKVSSSDGAPGGTNNMSAGKK